MNIEDQKSIESNIELSIRYLQNSLRTRMIENLRNVQHNTWIFNQNKNIQERSFHEDDDTWKGELSQINSEFSILTKQLALNTAENSKSEQIDRPNKLEDTGFSNKMITNSTDLKDDKSMFSWELIDEANLKRVIKCLFLPDLEHLYQSSVLYLIAETEEPRDYLFLYSNMKNKYYISELTRLWEQ